MAQRSQLIEHTGTLRSSESLIIRSHAQVSNPSLRHTPINGERYIAPEFMEREWDHIWTKVWLLVARAPDIPNSGDYALEDIGAESFVNDTSK